MKSKSYFVVLFVSGLLFSCGGKDSIPEKPQDVKSVKTFVKEKKFTTQKVGFYDFFTVNGKTEIKWVDITEQKKLLSKDSNDFRTKSTIEMVEEEMKFGIYFKNDTAATVFARDTSFIATYTIDNLIDQYDDGKEGIKIRLTYADPSFTFGGSTPLKMTFTYFVDGADDKRLLLQIPRNINGQALIGLLEAK